MEMLKTKKKHTHQRMPITADKMDHRQHCLGTLHYLESDVEQGKAEGICRDGFRKVIAKKTSLYEKRQSKTTMLKWSKENVMKITT